jgi:hypothetical protein
MEDKEEEEDGGANPMEASASATLDVTSVWDLTR